MLAEGRRRANLVSMPTMMGLPRWVVISTAATVVALSVITLAVLLQAGKQGGNPSERLMTKADVRGVLGPPDTIEVLRRAECWSYGPRREFTEAKLCFGERGRLAWYAWGNGRAPKGTAPPAPLFP
jgi:hypothetical protein